MANDPKVPSPAQDNANPGTARLTIGNEVYDLPIRHDTIGDARIVDITGLFQKAGVMTFDVGYTSTAGTESTITYIDGDNGILLYRGYPIEQLADKGSYMETAYLLLKGELPTAEQLQAFEADIVERMPLHQQMIAILERRLRENHPMNVIGSMVTDMAGFYKIDTSKPEGRYEVALNLIAKIPTMVAAAQRYSQGKPIIQPSSQLGYTENFLSMCFADARGHYVQNPVITQAMDRIFTLHADHEQNASTSTVRLAGSTGTQPYGAIAAGIAALAGPAHGGANEAVLLQLKEIGSVDRIPIFIERAKDKSDPFMLMGFGHRVYKNKDPRASIISGDCAKVLDALGVKDPLLDVARELERIALSDKYFIDRKLYPNVDFYSGIILKAMKFPVEMFTPLFALARTSGWIAQWQEMVNAPKLVIGRPRQNYVGPSERPYPAIETRGPNGAAARGTLTAPADASPKTGNGTA